MGTLMVQRSSGWQVEKESVVQDEDVEMGDHHTGSPGFLLSALESTELF